MLKKSSWIYLTLTIALTACSGSTIPNPATTTPPLPTSPIPTIIDQENDPTPPLTLTSSPTSTPSPSLTPTATWSIVGPGEVEIPILLYHHVHPDPPSHNYWIDAENFEDQMQVLSDLGYHTVTPTQLRQAILQGLQLPPKPVIITFDDGNEDNYGYAFPIMQKFGFIGAVYIVANRLSADGFLSAEQLKEMAAAGWEIGSHSMTHADLAEVTANKLREEILDSRLHLEREIGVEVRSFAYPFGSFVSALGTKVENYGYRTAMGLGKKTLHDLNTIYYLDRITIYGTMTLEEFGALLNGLNKI